MKIEYYWIHHIIQYIRAMNRTSPLPIHQISVLRNILLTMNVTSPGANHNVSQPACNHADHNCSTTHWCWWVLLYSTDWLVLCGYTTIHQSLSQFITVKVHVWSRKWCVYFFWHGIKVPIIDPGATHFGMCVIIKCSFHHAYLYSAAVNVKRLPRVLWRHVTKLIANDSAAMPSLP